MIAKGITISLVCLLIGGFIGYKVTWWELDRNAAMFFKGVEAGKKEALQKK